MPWAELLSGTNFAFRYGEEIPIKTRLNPVLIGRFNLNENKLVYVFTDASLIINVEVARNCNCIKTRRSNRDPRTLELAKQSL